MSLDKRFDNLIAQIEFGYKYFIGSCMSCYEDAKRQDESIKDGEKMYELSKRLETLLNEFGIYNVGNRIDFKWIQS